MDLKVIDNYWLLDSQSCEYSDTILGGCGPGDTIVGVGCQPSHYSNAASSDIFDIGQFEDQPGSVPSRPASSDVFDQANARSECEALDNTQHGSPAKRPRLSLSVSNRSLMLLTVLLSLSVKSAVKLLRKGRFRQTWSSTPHGQ